MTMSESVPMRGQQPNANLCNSKRRQRAMVNFNAYSKVILIPSRKEYRKAKCDLWWNSGDFFSFQQSANSECRLLSMFENIDIRSARRKLYQPTGDEYKDDVQVKENMNESVLSGEQSPYRKTNLNHPIPKVSSLKLIHSKSNDGNEQSSPSPSLTNPSSMDSINSMIMDHEESHLSLCVPLKGTVPLANRERRSRKRDPPGSLFQDVLAMVGFAALPFLGYYVVHYHFHLL